MDVNNSSRHRSPNGGPDVAVVAMSGGVDSSVAAYLVKEMGLEVIGITMQVWPTVDEGPMLPRSCCSLEAVDDARRVAWALGIRHYVLNFREPFERQVVDPFIAAYLAGRTPNPCLDCNRYIKFDLLLRRAAELDAKWLVTGHYARVAFAPDRNRYVLMRGMDERKDQSYALYMLTQEQMARTLLPLGELRKSRVREIASQLGLSVAAKLESQDICFIPDGNYKGFIDARQPESGRPGPIVDTGGRVLGAHTGIHHYTIGQRRGLGLAAGRPLYVLALDPATNTVVVGEQDELQVRSFLTSDNNFILLDKLTGPLAVQVKVRYKAALVKAVIRPFAGGQVLVELDEPYPAVAPGQAAVFYLDDLVVGGGTIDRVLKENDRRSAESVVPQV